MPTCTPQVGRSQLGEGLLGVLVAAQIQHGGCFRAASGCRQGRDPLVGGSRDAHQGGGGRRGQLLQRAQCGGDLGRGGELAAHQKPRGRGDLGQSAPKVGRNRGRGHR
ncbi:hypothetical protein BIV57_00820 [Mangrovactinospora gilvigrisea]|uniref:Uncharacterized protein n=1 Tax=Mangrovactinospora gilvigrisea TaxID=1428644 RepID=A0A1J7CCX8_9ACTN|nr:hypothetical protein BIV57_00820 [Mangrovactinospora gilvigrisea]